MNVPELIECKTTLLFDLFHTLTALEFHWPGTKLTCEMLGVSREAWNHQLLECSPDRLTGKITDPEQIIGQMAHAIDPNIPDTLITEVTATRIKRFESAMSGIPLENVDILQTLRDKGKKLALISNADVMEIQAWERASPIAKLFDVTVFSCHVGYAKPDPKIYQLTMRELAVDAKDCLFIGDGGSGELKGAQDCGITTVMITGLIQELWPERIESRKPYADFVIEHLSELIA
ncbi:MAG: HAD-IA family hydrolase [Pseudomonadota bacterium]